MCKAMHVMSMHRYSYKQKYTLQANPPQFLPNLLHCILALHCKEVSTQLQCRWNCHWRQYLQWPRPTWVSLAHQDLYCQSLTWHQVSTQGLLEKDLSSQDSTARLYLAGLMSSQNNATSAVHWPPFAQWESYQVRATQQSVWKAGNSPKKAVYSLSFQFLPVIL